MDTHLRGLSSTRAVPRATQGIQSLQPHVPVRACGDRQIPLFQGGNAFLDLTYKFGFQRDLMRKMVCYFYESVVLTARFLGLNNLLIWLFPQFDFVMQLLDRRASPNQALISLHAVVTKLSLPNS